MNQPRNRSTGAVVAFVCACATGAHGAMMFPDAPEGFVVQHSLFGDEGAASNESRWFSVPDERAVRTNWANESIDFDADLGADPIETMIGVTAKNVTPLVLPEGYDQFRVQVRVNGVFADELHIDASDDVWNTSWMNIGPLSGPTTVTLKWVNDSYKANVYDANIAIGGVSFAVEHSTNPPVVVAMSARAIPSPGTQSMTLMAAAIAIGFRGRDKHARGQLAGAATRG